MSETENIVRLELTASWFAVLMQELQFGSIVAGRADMSGHHPSNCDALWKMLMQQGGTGVKENKPTKPEQSQSKSEKATNRCSILRMIGL